MAAIQQIQNLIARSQPIPPDLQVAALLEAQQQGLSSNALAGVFGVPESMIADSVSALGLSGQLSPSLGGTLAPSTKFDNNVGVVSGRTAAAQENQPIELAPPALLPEGYGSTIDRPFSGVLSLPDIGSLRGNVFDEDLEYQDAKELYQDIQEGLFSGATDSAGAVLKAIIDSTIASQNQAGTSAGNFPTTEAAIEALNNVNDPTAGLINLTVGSNQPFVDTSAAAGGGGGGSTADKAAAAATVDPVGDSTSSLEPDADLMGTSGGIVDSTASATSTDVSGATGGLKVGDVVTDDRIVGDYEYVYDAENNVFHYSPFDYEGNRIYTGETIDASTVGGFDPTQTSTGATKGIMIDPVTKQPVVEHSGDATTDSENTTTTTTTNNNVIDLITNGLLNVANVLGSKNKDTTLITGPFQTQAEENAAAAANAATLGDDFNTASDSNNTGETLTVGDTNGNGGTGDTNGNGDTSGNGDTFNTATDSNNTGETLTVGDTTGDDTTGDGGDGGGDGTGDGTGDGSGDGTGDGTGIGDGSGSGIGDGTGNGKDGKDGKDGATGLIMMGMLSSPIANNIFKTEFESNYLRPEYVDRILRGKGMNNNGRNT